MTYCVVFSGRLLEGHDPAKVRQTAAKSLNLSIHQVERLFSGVQIVLKAGVSEASGKLYLEVLRRYGMNAGLVRLPEGNEADGSTAGRTYKLVFWGRILGGAAPDTVKQAAAIRLKVPATTVEQIFCGRKVVLKRGLPLKLGARYIAELARIGMQTDLEAEETPARATPEPAIPSAETAARHPPAFPAEPQETDTGFERTQFDLPASNLDDETRWDEELGNQFVAPPPPDFVTLETGLPPAVASYPQMGEEHPTLPGTDGPRVPRQEPERLVVTPRPPEPPLIERAAGFVRRHAPILAGLAFVIACIWLMG